MAELSAYDQERITHINHVMDGINEKSSEIYEGLIDRDYPESIKSIDSLIDELNELKKTISNDILEDI